MPRVYTYKAARRSFTARDKSIPAGFAIGDPKPHRKCGR